MALQIRCPGRVFQPCLTFCVNSWGQKRNLQSMPACQACYSKHLGSAFPTSMPGPSNAAVDLAWSYARGAARRKVDFRNIAYVYIHVAHIYSIYIYIYICTYIHLFTQMCFVLCVSVLMWVYVYIYIHIAGVRVHMYERIYIYIYTYLCRQMCIHRSLYSYHRLITILAYRVFETCDCGCMLL